MMNSLPSQLKTAGLILLLGFVTPSLVSPASAQGDAASICLKMSAAYTAAANSGDPARVVSLFTPNGEWTAPQGIFKGPGALTAYASAFISHGDDHLDKQANSQLLNGVAVCSGDYTFTFAPGAPIRAVSGHFTKVLVRSAEQWRIAELTTNFAPPPMPTSNAQAQAH